MIEYNTKNWISVIFNMHKTHVLKVLFPSVMVMGIYSAIIIFATHNIIGVDLSGSTVVHSLLGIVLGLLLVFRTNTAYERWWEGRKLWGSLVNNSRNFAMKINAFLPEEDNQTRIYFAKLLSNFSFSLKSHLRSEVNFSELEEMHLFPVHGKKHIPVALLTNLFSKLNEIYKKNIISGEQFLIIDKQAESFADIAGACERIRNTPIPYSYNLHLKKYIFFYVITLPWGLMHELKYWAVPAVMLVFYAMVGIELIGEEIEDPFGNDADDLPLDNLCRNIRINVHEILSITD